MQCRFPTADQHGWTEARELSRHNWRSTHDWIECPTRDASGDAQTVSRGVARRHATRLRRARSMELRVQPADGTCVEVDAGALSVATCRHSSGAGIPCAFARAPRQSARPLRPVSNATAEHAHRVSAYGNAALCALLCHMWSGHAARLDVYRGVWNAYNFIGRAVKSY